MIYWLTGQPGAGKTTIAKWLEAHFVHNVIIIDGDDIREVYQNKDYSETGRRNNVEQAQELAKFLHYKGYKVIVALVSPYKDQRDEFKSLMGNNVVEIYVHTTDIRGREHYHVKNYQPPTEFFIDVDTTNENELYTIQKLRKLL